MNRDAPASPLINPVALARGGASLRLSPTVSTVSRAAPRLSHGAPAKPGLTWIPHHGRAPAPWLFRPALDIFRTHLPHLKFEIRPSNFPIGRALALRPSKFAKCQRTLPPMVVPRNAGGPMPNHLPVGRAYPRASGDRPLPPIKNRQSKIKNPAPSLAQKCRARLRHFAWFA
jgi:hypothetical protein